MFVVVWNFKNKIIELLEYLEMIYIWIVGFINCFDDVLCMVMCKVIEFYDIVVIGMNELFIGVDCIFVILI